MKPSFVLHCLPYVLALSLLTACRQAPPPAQRSAAPPPFDEKADAKAAIHAAIERTADDGIRVLITWGANDGKGSTQFLTAVRAPSVFQSGLLMDEYRNVNVNVGHVDRNIDLANSYGATLKENALPALTVLDSAGKVLANTDASALRSGADPAGIDPAKVIAFLNLHKAAAPDAVALFDAAVTQAKKGNKNVFAWFSAPW
jgi:protein disulfide-isomerase